MELDQFTYQSCWGLIYYFGYPRYSGSASMHAPGMVIPLGDICTKGVRAFRGLLSMEFRTARRGTKLLPVGIAIGKSLPVDVFT